MTYIVTITHKGIEIPLRGTVWAGSMDRAEHFDTREATLAALNRAAKFMQKTIYKKAVIKEITATADKPPQIT